MGRAGGCAFWLAGCAGRAVFIVSDMQQGFHAEKILFSR